MIANPHLIHHHDHEYSDRDHRKPGDDHDLSSCKKRGGIEMFKRRKTTGTSLFWLEPIHKIIPYLAIGAVTVFFGTYTFSLPS